MSMIEICVVKLERWVANLETGKNKLRSWLVMLKRWVAML
jgi:hypothetical protein